MSFEADALFRRPFIAVFVAILVCRHGERNSFAQESETFQEVFISFPEVTIPYRKVTHSSMYVDRPLKETPIPIVVPEFELAMYELTVGQFREFVQATQYETDVVRGKARAMSLVILRGKTRVTLKGAVWNNVPFEQTDLHPVTCVSFDDAKQYCRWRTENDPKYLYRLPTGAEWQRACLGETDGEFDFDIKDRATHVNVLDKSFTQHWPGYPDVDFDDGFPTTAPVNSGRPGRTGCIYLHGNIGELCSVVADINPDLVAQNHLICGGSWFSNFPETSAEHPAVGASFAGTFTGFRLVRQLKVAIANSSEVGEAAPVQEEFIDVPAGKMTYYPATSTLRTLTESEAGGQVISLNAFSMGKYEVTLDQYREFVSATQHRSKMEQIQRARSMSVEVVDGQLKAVGSTLTWDHDGFPRNSQHPVTCLSAYDVIAYCEWRTQEDEKYVYRLPTAAEWQFAAGMTASRQFDFPEGTASEFTNLQDRSLQAFAKGPAVADFDDGFAVTAPVNAKPATASGFVFLHGNISEIVLPVAEVNPELMKDYVLIVGGDFFSTLDEAKLKHQIHRHKIASSALTGFRLVRLAK